MWKKVAGFAAFVLFSGALQAQVSISPTFAVQSDTVIITFNATGGTGGLAGVSQVYIHTGVITNQSTSATDWRHVQGNWGTDDPKVRMTALGNDLHEIKFHINTYYNVPSNETVQSLAMVFRNVDGSKEGKDVGGTDFFVPIYTAGLQASLTVPSGALSILGLNDTLLVEGGSSQSASLRLYHENTLLKQETNATVISYKLYTGDFGPGKFNLRLEAQQGTTILHDTAQYLARAATTVAADPYNAEEGITVLNPTTLFFKLRAPDKDLVYLIGDFNGWELDPAFDMKQTPDGEHFWLEVPNLDPETEYRLQYFVGAEGIRIADPYSEKILDPWNDRWITAAVYPNLISYPHGFTDYPVTAFKINEEEYTWDNSYSYQRPASEELVIYEMLIRDFDSRHTYLSVIDRLPYFDSLGINALELMPILEFEGNESWGYNPMFFMAPDKYYGTKNDFKALVDSCHKHGIAVLLDVALNHAFGQSPLVRMYFENGQPAANSPYFNQVPKHDFNVGYDFNHEAPATMYHTKRVFQHWVEEYKVDGYRVDLSKGFTQRNTLGNIGLMGQYDQSRINILNRIKNDVFEIDPEAIMILEHFADAPEEQALAAQGFLLWANENHQYSEATMGYGSNLSNIYHKNKGFAAPAGVGFMESHDEERLMYRAVNFGNSNGGYNVRDEATALKRMALGATFFFTVPGPKMMWQFGEMGYDYSINHCPDGTIDNGCRLANKPIRWDYLQDANRAKLHKTYRQLLHWRAAFPSVFQSDSIAMDVAGPAKTIHLYTADSNAVTVGNFNVLPRQYTLNFPHDGKWFEAFSGDSVVISNQSLSLNMAPGDYKLYFDFKPELPEEPVVIDTPSTPIDSSASNGVVSFYPNPTQGTLKAFVKLTRDSDVLISLFTPMGKVVYSERFFGLKKGNNVLDLGNLKHNKGLAQGILYYRFTSATQKEEGALMILP
jgi:hypothetical protein